MRKIKKVGELSRFFLSAVGAVIASAILISGFASPANATLLSATATTTALINPAGGTDAGSSQCATSSVVVGFRWSGGTSTASPYSIYCRALNADGTIPADQSTTSNSTQVTVYYSNSATNVSFCPAGTIATGVRHRGWSDFALICNTPPSLSDADQYSKTVTTPTDRSCAVNAALVGMGRYTGAWLDSLYGVCRAYAANTLSYNVNSGSGTAPPSVSRTVVSPTVATSTAYTGTRTGFTFSGWNTAANGSGTNYPAGSNISVTSAITLYAQWNSTITYNGNGNDGGTVPAPTIATSSAAVTQLATNIGLLTKTNYTFGGWNTAANGTGTSYAAGLSTYSSAGNVTLYAQWNSTITYNGNSNTSGTAPASQTAIGQKPITLQGNSGTLARTNFTFGGWNTAADGSGTSYAASATNYISTGSTTLYAMWNTTPSVPDLVASSDTGSSNTDNVTGDSTPEFTVSNLTVGASVTIELRNSGGTLVGSCTFVATSGTGSCNVSTATSGTSYTARVTQTFGSSTTTSTSLTGITIDATGPTPQVTVVSGSSITWTTNQTGQVTSNELGSVYLVRNSLSVTDETSITSAATNLWKKVTISSASVNTNVTLSGLLGGTFRAYAFDQHGNRGGPSTNSLILYSQPAAATSLIATAGSGSMGPKIDLAWTSPTDDGGGIDFYNVEYSTDGGTTWLTYPNKAGVSSPFSIYPVEYGTTYQYRISGVNRWGVGIASVSSNTATPTMPTCSPTLSPNGKTNIFPVGACSWTVPAGVTSVNVDARGGQGGWGIYGYGNGGGRVTGTLTVTPGETLYFYIGDQGSPAGNVLSSYVGRPGFNGGGWGGTTTSNAVTNGAYMGGGGGGATDIRTSTALNNRIVVAGSSGGSAYGQGNSCCYTIGWGGAGGGTTGGVTTTSDGSSGGAGTQSAGGARSGSSGTGGALGLGGEGANTGSDATINPNGGGGGGAGYYGGGGGSASIAGRWFSGGGGGSSYVGSTRFTSTTNVQNVNCAPGFLAITIGNDLTQVPGFTRPCNAAADITPPVISTQTVSTDGRTLTLTYTDANNMSGTYFDPTLFTVTSAGANVAISSISASGKTLVITLARNLVPSATTTISYTEPSGSDDFYAVQDAFGNDAISFTNRTIVTTGITVAIPTAVTLDSASDTGTSSTDKITKDNTPTVSASSLIIGATVTFSARIGTGTPITCVITAAATTDTCTFPTLPDGTYSITVIQTSGTTNSAASTALTNVQIDTARPTVTLTSANVVSGGNLTATPTAPNVSATITITFSKSVTGLLISEVSKNAESTGWAVTTTAFTTAAITSINFVAANATGAGGVAGTARFSIAEGVATDTAGNTNLATTSNFVINTLIQLNLTNEYQQSPLLSPVVGGNNATIVQTSPGQTLSMPGAGTLTRTGHTFAGWSLVTTNGSGPIVGPTYTPTVPVKLYSSWTPNIYVVSYNTNGGVGLPTRSTDSYNYGSPALTLPTIGTMTRQGFTFRGWGTTSTTAVGSAMTTTYTPTASITLYAIWQGNPYTVTFNKNESSATGTMATQSITGGTAVNASANAFARVGYTFGSWNTAADGTGTSVSNSGSMTFFNNTTLYAQWVVVAPGAPGVTATSSGNTTATVTVTGIPTSGTTVGPTASYTVQAYSATDDWRLVYQTTNTNRSGNNIVYSTGYGKGASDQAAVLTSQGFTFNRIRYRMEVNYNGVLRYADLSFDKWAGATIATVAIPDLADNRTIKVNVGNVNIDSNWPGFAGVASAVTTGTNKTGRLELWPCDYSAAVSGITPAGSNTTYDFDDSPVCSGTYGSFQFHNLTDSQTVLAWNRHSGVVDLGFGNRLTADPDWTFAGNSGFTLGTWKLQIYIGNEPAPLTGRTCTVLATASPLSCEITGLTNNTTYRFKATATNATASATGAMSMVTATPLPYVVTYAPNGGTLSPATANYDLGTPLTLPLPTKTGHDFAGWNNPSNQLVGLNGATYSPSASITLTAQWSPYSYNVIYNGNGASGGSVPSTGTYTYGATYTIAAKGTMTKTGYNFAGWNSIQDGSGVRYANASDGIASSSATFAGNINLTLYAQWTPQTYTITYSANGGSGTPVRTSDSYTYGSAPLTLPAGTGLTRAGFTFSGWSESTSGSTVDNSYITSQSRTLYALWTGARYLITYDVNGGTGSVADATYTFGDPGITLNNGGALSRYGYTFAGWKNLAGTTVSGAPFTTSEDLTLYAIWTPKNIAITYARGSAVSTTLFPSAGSANYGSNVTLPARTAVDTLTAIGGNNYAFAGWSVGGVTYQPGDLYRITTDSSITITAEWLRLFDVRYNLNGGAHGAGDSATESECVTGGLCTNTQVITLNGAPTRVGFIFNGWVNQDGVAIVDSDGGLAGTQTALSESNYIFYATWTPSTFTFTFAPGLGSAGSATLAATPYGDTVTLPLSTGYTLAGSKFSGWLIGSTLYPAGSFYTVGADASPITATAQFINDTFKIFYNTNGSDTGVAPGPTVALQGAAITLNDATGFGRSGYTFNGWLDGTTSRAAGFATTMGGQNSTLIATWTLNPPGTPTIASVSAGDSGATITVAPATTGGAPTSYTITANPGGATCTVISPATSCSISPLTNGTAYTFSATATNSAGTSASATSSAVTPAGVPATPSAASAIRGNGQATVTVVPLAEGATGGKAITAYTVTAYDASGNAVGTPCQVIPAATTCDVTGLTNGDAYTFKVSATNGVYNSSLSVSSSAVTPATVPGAPTAVTAVTTTPNSATISFTPPVSTGGDAITSYTVTSSPGGFTCTVAAPGTSCTISGSLTNGIAYTFTAIATNSVGNSTPSSGSTAITPIGPPAAPTGVSATAGDGGATISFTAPNANGSAITGYLVTALDQNGVPLSPAVTCTPAPGATTCEITTGLTNGVPYKFSVVATNSVGPSLAGVTSATTTPLPRVAPSSLDNGVPTGTTSTGQTLAAPQVFDGIPFPVITYQWQRCTAPDDLSTCTNITGATSSSYVMTAADVDKYIRVLATATNIVSSITVPSFLTDQVTGIPQATTPTTGLSGNLNESYTLATAAFGGATPLDYAITSGTLPAGLTLDPLTGNITGTPTVAGTFTITVRATDQKGASSTITFTLTIVDPTPPTPTPTPTPAPTPTPTPLNPGAEDAAAAAAAKAAAEKAAADAAAKAAAEKAAADAAVKAAADASAKLAADRAAADAAAKLAAEKKAAADQAQAQATAAAQIAAARATAAAAAQKSAADAAARAAALARSNLVSNAAKRAADLQARNAAAAAATAVRNAASAANAASTANATAAAASKEVVITVGALTSAQSAAEKSAALEAQTAAAKSAAKAAANAAAAQAQIERDRAAAATKAAADALAAAAEKQRLAAEAAARARVEAEVLAKASSERAAAQVNAEKVASEVATLLSEQARVTEQMIAAKDPEAIAQAQAALEVISEKLKTAQDALSDAVAAVETATTTETTFAANVQKAIARAETTSKSARKANSEATKRRSEARAVVTQALVSERAAKSAAAAAKKVTVPKATPPPSAPVSAGKSDATISVGGLKPGQKIRVIVKVNVKVNVK